MSARYPAEVDWTCAGVWPTKQQYCHQFDLFRSAGLAATKVSIHPRVLDIPWTNRDYLHYSGFGLLRDLEYTALPNINRAGCQFAGQVGIAWQTPIRSVQSKQTQEIMDLRSTSTNCHPISIMEVHYHNGSIMDLRSTFARFLSNIFNQFWDVRISDDLPTTFIASPSDTRSLKCWSSVGPSCFFQVSFEATILGTPFLPRKDVDFNVIP